MALGRIVYSPRAGFKTHGSGHFAQMASKWRNGEALAFLARSAGKGTGNGDPAQRGVRRESPPADKGARRNLWGPYITA